MNPMTPYLATRHSASPPETSLILRAGFWMCLGVGVAIVVRRVIALSRTSLIRNSRRSAPPALATLDRWFQAHAALTYAHILVSLVFLCVLPLIFWRRTRHQTAIRSLYYALGTGVGVTAYRMSAFSVGGWTERSAVLCFNSLFLIALAQSFRAWRRDRPAGERRWDLRASATALGIATTRPVMGIFFATSRATQWTPNQFFGPAFWIGFSINVVIMESWLRGPGRSAQKAG